VSTQPTPRLTRQEYLAIERNSEQKHEFYRGKMFATGGASVAHNAGLHISTIDCTIKLTDIYAKVQLQ
jgi:hypothetical protein